jgi:hypothetical protein
MKKSLFIHIGMPKTGSSAIQALLTINHNKLSEKGYLFPNPPRFDQVFQTSSGNVGMFQKLFINNDIDGIKNFIDSFDNNKALILSSEALFDILRLYPDRFFTVFNEYNFKIICYVRRQDNLISSCYNQLIKNHDATSLSVINHIVKTNDFGKTLLDSLSYAETEKIIVRPYEKQQFYGGNIFADFLNCIGLELDDDFIYPDKIVNPSFDWGTLEFRRTLNILEVDRGNLMKKHSINALLAKYTVDKNMGRPFQDSNIFSPKERIEIIDSHKEINEQVAKIFLKRENGILFNDPLPKIDSSWQKNEGMTIDKTLDICKHILNTKYKDNLEETLINSIVKGTIDRILYSDQLSNEDIKHMPLLYSLNNVPIEISKDISILEKKLGLWYIESCGNDPYFTIPKFNKNNKGQLFVKIDITTSSDTVLQLFYMSDNDRFDSDHCISRSLKKGYNEIIIKINDNEAVKSLRLDPGNVEGIYLLHDFEVKVEK